MLAGAGNVMPGAIQGITYLMVVDFESLPSAFVALTVILFIPVINVKLAVRTVVPLLYVNPVKLTPFTVMLICEEFTFVTVAVKGYVGVVTVDPGSAGFVMVTTGGFFGASGQSPSVSPCAKCAGHAE